LGAGVEVALDLPASGVAKQAFVFRRFREGVKHITFAGSSAHCVIPERVATCISITSEHIVVQAVDVLSVGWIGSVTILKFRCVYEGIGGVFYIDITSLVLGDPIIKALVIRVTTKGCAVEPEALTGDVVSSFVDFVIIFND